MADINLQGFSTIEFRPLDREFPAFVYVWCWESESGLIPFYVGQTNRIWGRLDDYYWAMFNASTDFRVGEAVRHLSAKGHKVIVKYRKVREPRRCEAEMIKDLTGSGRKLLNCLRGFNYKTSDEPTERLRIQKFINELLTPTPDPQDPLREIALQGEAEGHSIMA